MKNTVPPKRKPLVYKSGFTESLWKSCVVKSQRIGWPAGLERAAKELNQSTMRSLLVCGIFEDTFPAVEELPDVVAEVNRSDFEALCARETHHGRGLTPAYISYEVESVEAMKNRRGEIYNMARPFGIWLPPRALNCFYTWEKIRPKDAGVKRTVDPTPWGGMPYCMRDAHTYEGKALGIVITLLSGHYINQKRLGERVMELGWGPVRNQMHAEGIVPPRLPVQGDLTAAG